MKMENPQTNRRPVMEKMPETHYNGNGNGNTKYHNPPNPESTDRLPPSDYPAKSTQSPYHHGHRGEYGPAGFHRSQQPPTPPPYHYQHQHQQHPHSQGGYQNPNHHQQQNHYQHQYHHHQQPPQQPQHPYPAPHPHHPQQQAPSSRSQLPIQSVVTTSFSMDDERDCRGAAVDGRYQMEHREGSRQPERSPYAPPKDERDGHPTPPPPPTQPERSSQPPQQHEPEHQQRQVGRELPPIREHHAETSEPTRSPGAPPNRVPPSPRITHPDRQMFNRTRSMDGSIQSTVSYSASKGPPLKRSFWHHSRPDDEYHQQPGLPSEFIPPKRTKLSSAPPGTEYGMASRPSSSYDEMASAQQPQYYNRSMSTDSGNEMHYLQGRRAPADSWDRQNRSPPSYRREPASFAQWNESPSIPQSSSSRFVSPDTMSPWNTSRSNSWNVPPSGPDPYWNRQRPEDPRNMWPDARDDMDMRRQSTFDSIDDRYHQYSPYTNNSNGNSRMGFPPIQHRRSFDGNNAMPIMNPPEMPKGPAMPPMSGHPPSQGMVAHESQAYGGCEHGAMTVLALQEDRISLSETLCVVRENIEVFTATVQDVEAPAPGRKHAVVVGQVGLRCVHCRHKTKSSERVKRAVCYPSSIKRIYRTVIDMKLDHFSHCKFVPAQLKETLHVLKANNTRSTGTTMQYFIRAAGKLGMLDAPNGVRMAQEVPPPPPPPHHPTAIGQPAASSTMDQIRGPDQVSRPQSEQMLQKKPPPRQQQAPNSPPRELLQGREAMSAENSPLSDAGSAAPPSLPVDSQQTSVAIARSSSMSSTGVNSDPQELAAVPDEIFMGKVPLGLPEDKASLSPLRCFLREQVCAFAATEDDILVRNPTTVSVSPGQVGVGCAHCLKQPPKMRLNRAISFPFSVTRIYQAVADIQRFHLGECKHMPEDVKAVFLKLQGASSKGSKGLATRQYWITSANKIGLIDTTSGIRFGRDPEEPGEKPFSLDILAQVASDVKTSNKPLVLPEDKPSIAEFLYAVIAQLQPCRFTEADRNKRRLKDVGCIGVECKHCSGKVDSRKFFWSTVSAVESNFVSVHTHMFECTSVPDELKERLTRLKKLRKQQTAALKIGSQKAFFTNVWKRLHQAPLEKAEPEEVADASRSASTAASAVASPASSTNGEKEPESQSIKKEDAPSPDKEEGPLIVSI